jgi:hypothetical protein
VITELVNISFLRAIEIYRRNCRHFSSADGFVSPLFVVVVVVVAARVIFLITIFLFSNRIVLAPLEFILLRASLEFLLFSYFPPLSSTADVDRLLFYIYGRPEPLALGRRSVKCLSTHCTTQNNSPQIGENSTLASILMCERLNGPRERAGAEQHICGKISR